MNILQSLLTVDADIESFPLQGGKFDFLVQSKDALGELKSTFYSTRNNLLNKA